MTQISSINILSYCIRRQTKLEKLVFKDFKDWDNESVYTILDACSQISSLKTIPRVLFLNNDFLESEDNVDILCQCIQSQLKMKNFDMKEIEVNGSTASKVLAAYSNSESLQKIYMFRNDAFFSQAEQFDSFIQFVQRQKSLKKIDFQGVTIDDNQAVKLIQALTQFTSLQKIMMFKCAGNFLE